MDTICIFIPAVCYACWIHCIESNGVWVGMVVAVICNYSIVWSVVCSYSRRKQISIVVGADDRVAMVWRILRTGSGWWFHQVHYGPSRISSRRRMAMLFAITDTR